VKIFSPLNWRLFFRRLNLGGVVFVSVTDYVTPAPKNSLFFAEIVDLYVPILGPWPTPFMSHQCFDVIVSAFFHPFDRVVPLPNF